MFFIGDKYCSHGHYGKFYAFLQTQTQAERKIMERKRQAILMEASENIATDLTPFEEKLAKHDALKSISYGTIHAVSASFVF